MKNQVQLITYVDRLADGGLQDLATLIRGPMKDLFGCLHLLPFFDPIDGADAGFDPVDHTRIDPRLGTWEDLSELANETGILSDLIANHVSRQSPQCQDFLSKGNSSVWAELFLTQESVFPEGASPEQLEAIYRPRPGLPFSPTTLGDGSEANLWTTFTPDQIDINVTSAAGQQYLDGILQTFAASGVNMVRLDAIGYAIKKPGTSCFMLPETFDYIRALSERVHELGMEVLVEIHSHYSKQVEIARLVDYVYDFALPPLILHAFTFDTSAPLKHWLKVRPDNALTVLDTHDGIGVIDIGANGDLPGLVPPKELDALVEAMHKNSNEQSRQATGAAASNLDLYQVNCTYFDALGGDDLRYLLARTLQFFVPGIPQVYYTGLLAGRNDMALLEKTGVGRDINRHYYSSDEVLEAMKQPVVQSLCALIRLRNTHPAFNGDFSMPDCGDDRIVLHWQSGEDFAEFRLEFIDEAYCLQVSDNGSVRDIDLLALR